MKYFLHVFFMGMLLSLHSFSQTITYKQGLPDLCNVFNVATPPVINGFQHYPISGGVLFFHGDSAISLPCQAGSTKATMLGTAYAIRYPFKEGYTYSLKVVAWQPDLPSLYNINLSFSMIDALPDPTKTHPDGCGGVDEDKWFDLATTTVNVVHLDTNTTKVRDVNTFLMDQDHNFLTVVAWMNPLPNNTPSAAFIRQLIITETPPTYTLAPAGITKVCGTPISQTFTVTDVHNSGKVSAYTWNLGANNGWLYNGAPAPQTITTATPTLDLTADGCNVPSNITAAATRPNGTFSTNPSVVTPSFGSITLNGPSQICDVATFTLDGLPCGATVAWSLSSPGNGTLSSTTGSTTTLTRTGNDRIFSINADIITACGKLSLGRGLQVVGQPEPFLITSVTDIPCQSGKVVPSVSFTATPATANTTYNWSWEGTSGLGTLVSHTARASGKFSLGSYTVTATAFNACGITEGPTFQFNILPCQFLASAADNIAVSPNPAVNVITVTTNATTKEALKVQATTDIREVRILDKTGALLRKQSFPAGTTTATINVESFKPDIYILQIGDGKIFKTRKITISR